MTLKLRHQTAHCSGCGRRRGLLLSVARFFEHTHKGKPCEGTPVPGSIRPGRD